LDEKKEQRKGQGRNWGLRFNALLRKVWQVVGSPPAMAAYKRALCLPGKGLPLYLRWLPQAELHIYLHFFSKLYWKGGKEIKRQKQRQWKGRMALVNNSSDLDVRGSWSTRGNKNFKIFRP
jgi:hypothetical protein